MIKEFAFSFNKRHYFQDVSEMGNWQNIDNDTFMSLYDYDDYVKDFFVSNKTLAGFDGLLYMPDEFVLDVDGSSLSVARQKAVGLKILLEDVDVPYILYFSGTGFHFHIPADAFRWKPDKDLHLKVKDALTKKGVFDYADSSVTDKTRLIRIPNTMNTKSRLYKISIKASLLTDIDFDKKIEQLAKKPGKIEDDSLECNPVFDVLDRTPKASSNTPKFVSQGRNPDPVNYPCISSMLNVIPVGKRHAVALRLAAWFRWLYPEDTVRLVMEDWRKKVNTTTESFKASEMESIINSCYDGHRGQGYRYGCNDHIMDDHCQNTCRLYKSKKNQVVMTSSDMENTLVSFFREDIQPINLGDIYENENFPIYPGEVVIIQAPPKSMKTMLLQNWVNAFKKPTYFIEMEMSPRQVWSRFVMIENEWNEGQLKEHYQQMRNGMDNRFKWLTVDYSAPYASELDKRVSMLPVKPEIVVVDHMGLFKSKQRDPNMKVEEASQAMMELAVKHNLIVFAVSEINKSAMREGLNIFSSKGSFRTAYNANKILSLIPRKSKTTGMIEMLDLRCEANRERENLVVRLSLDNVRIVKDDTQTNA